MNHAAHLARLLDDLGVACGIRDLAADASGYCCLSTDTDTHLQFQLNPQTGLLTLFSSLGVVDGEHGSVLASHFLHANLFWQGTGGATIGVDASDRQAVIARRVTIDRLDGPHFIALVDAFMRMVEAWQDYLRDIGDHLDSHFEPPPPLTGGGIVWG